MAQVIHTLIAQTTNPLGELGISDNIIKREGFPTIMYSATQRYDHRILKGSVSIKNKMSNHLTADGLSSDASLDLINNDGFFDQYMEEFENGLAVELRRYEGEDWNSFETLDVTLLWKGYVKRVTVKGFSTLTLQMRNQITDFEEPFPQNTYGDLYTPVPGFSYELPEETLIPSAFGRFKGLPITTFYTVESGPSAGYYYGLLNYLYTPLAMSGGKPRNGDLFLSSTYGDLGEPPISSAFYEFTFEGNPFYPSGIWYYPNGKTVDHTGAPPQLILDGECVRRDSANRPFPGDSEISFMNLLIPMIEDASGGKLSYPNDFTSIWSDWHDETKSVIWSVVNTGRRALTYKQWIKEMLESINAYILLNEEGLLDIQSIIPSGTDPFIGTIDVYHIEQPPKISTNRTPGYKRLDISYTPNHTLEPTAHVQYINSIVPTEKTYNAKSTFLAGAAIDVYGSPYSEYLAKSGLILTLTMNSLAGQYRIGQRVRFEYSMLGRDVLPDSYYKIIGIDYVKRELELLYVD
jgi:hypothetical protein